MVVLYGNDGEATMAALEWLQNNGIEQIDCRDITMPPYNSTTRLIPTVEADRGILEGFSEEAYLKFFSTK